jgi:sugar/nucleoside kinase (ribokinase family)
VCVAVQSQDLDVVGIGSAIVDVIAQADDEFLIRHDMVKGSMRLIETEEEAERLYDAMGPAVEMSGGSCANTMAGLAGLGGAGAFVGIVKDDLLGEVFTHDIRSIGVEYPISPATDGAATARCLIIVTPDAQRTLNTYLGAASGLTADHIDTALIDRARVVYLEGYLWDLETAKKAMVAAMQAAAASGARVAFTLSDGFCVDRHRPEFLDLVEHHVDILFANEAEICSLYEVEEFDDALQHVRGHCEIACLTRSEKGSVIVAGDEVHVVDTHPVEHVVDTTGAGDLYAAGFLYGFTHGHDLATSGRVGAAAAAEVISHVGARPETDLRALVADLLD